jgi:2-dehydro-3-deoxyphosphooctonate aldolase (KDO 8-P synthase)
VKPIQIGPVSIGDGRLFLIAGPCVIESENHAVGLARTLRDAAARLGVPYIYKASYDKANRTSLRSFRGPGLDEGLRILRRVRDEVGVPVLTDIHEPSHAAPVGEVADVLQIPAFLCRQTDLLEAAGATGKPVNVKKGQWMHPEGMRGAVRKVRRAAARHARGASLVAVGNQTSDEQASSDLQSRSEVAVTERGTFFGYGDLVVDMRCFARMREACDAPVIFDGTHSVQQPGRGEGGASGGAREFIASLTLAAVAAGANGLFLETHPTPETAPSDGPNMLPLRDLDAVVVRAIDIWTVVSA